MLTSQAWSNSHFCTQFLGKIYKKKNHHIVLPKFVPGALYFESWSGLGVGPKSQLSLQMEAAFQCKPSINTSINAKFLGAIFYEIVNLQTQNQIGVEY